MIPKNTSRNPRKKLRYSIRIVIPALTVLCVIVFLRHIASAVYTVAVPGPRIENSDMYFSSNEDEDNDSIIVWLDAGHGGADIGTYVMHNGVRVYEKDITLSIVLKVYELFQQSQSDVKILLTRSDDSYMHRHNRIRQWNYTAYTIAKADLVVSVHVDFYEGPTAQQVCGIQVNYYQNKYGNTGRVAITDRHFAQIMQDNMISSTGARDRSIRGDRRFSIPVLSTMPAILIETGFMSNYNELSKLLTTEYQMSIAEAIYNGIVEAAMFRV